MVDTSPDLLYGSAATWLDLMEYRYVFTYGYRKKLHRFTLSFYAEDFYHLAGLHYLDDISLPLYNRGKYPRKIFEGRIRYSDIVKSQYFAEYIEPRLKALSRLQDILENDFTLYEYHPELYSFTTTIDANYVIYSNIEAGNFVFFVKVDFDKSVDSNYLCKSIFEMDYHDFRQNQRSRALLKKEKVHIKDGTVSVLFNRLPPDNSF